MTASSFWSRRDKCQCGCRWAELPTFIYPRQCEHCDADIVTELYLTLADYS